MYIKRNIDFSLVWRFAWPKLIFFTVLALGAVQLHHYYEHMGVDLTIPFLPLSTIGIAVAFYIGFKNNSAYDRFWEARKIWGGIVNYSRTWANQVRSYVAIPNVEKGKTVGEEYEIHKQMIYRHLAYINALRLQLRMPTTFSIKPKGRVKSMMADSPQLMHWDDEVGNFLCKEEYECVSQRQNTATQIVRKQGAHLTRLKDAGYIDDFRHMEMMKVLEELYNLQGKAERIKKTPFPRQYAYFSKLFTWIFILLLPFGLVGLFAALGHHTVYLTIPFSVLISWIFFTMESIGDSSEDPFEGFVNDVPMSSLCRIIEIDLRDMLFESDIPEQIKPVNNVLL